MAPGVLEWAQEDASQLDAWKDAALEQAGDALPVRKCRLTGKTVERPSSTLVNGMPSATVDSSASPYRLASGVPTGQHRCDGKAARPRPRGD